MPKPRRSGGSVSIRSSSSLIEPPDNGSNPAMQLSAVDLPQPDGPSNAMNSPRRIVSVNSSSALNTFPPLPAKRLVTRSRRSSLKSCFMALDHRPVVYGRTVDGVDPRIGAAWKCSARLARTDITVPATERLDDCFRVEGGYVRKLAEPRVVFGPAELADRVLAFLGRHRQRHVLHRRPRIEIALVVSQCLRLGLQQVGHQVEHDGELFSGNALRHRHVVRVVHPRHVPERCDLVRF